MSAVGVCSSVLLSFVAVSFFFLESSYSFSSFGKMKKSVELCDLKKKERRKNKCVKWEQTEYSEHISQNLLLLTVYICKRTLLLHTWRICSHFIFAVFGFSDFLWTLICILYAWRISLFFFSEDTDADADILTKLGWNALFSFRCRFRICDTCDFISCNFIQNI